VSRPPAAADPDDQDAVDSLWQKILNKLGLGDDDASTSGAQDDSTGKDSTGKDSADGDSADEGSASTSPTTTAPSTTGSTATAGSTASGQAMPTTAPAGWSQVLAEDFTTPAALGTFPGPAYAAHWDGYAGFTDTSGVGTYTPDRVVSVADGALDLNLHTENGKALVAAPVPQVDGKWGGWTYGRYSVRFRADDVPGYKTAWLLWPDSDDWNDGEIDFPEGDLDGSISGFVHQPGDPSSNALAIDTGASYTDWHTATIEWLPDGVTFFLDGEQVGHTDVSPSTPMHLVLQTETSGQPPAEAAGHVQIDWITLARHD